jgi:uncharacterized protein
VDGLSPESLNTYIGAHMVNALPILTTAVESHSDPSLVVSPPERWQQGLARLRSVFSESQQWIVAFSGGIDSTFVLKVALEERGDEVLALTAVSPTLPDEEREECIELARAMGARHLLIDSHEMNRSDFVNNPTNRCYFCKDELYSIARDQANRLGVEQIADGVNVDDLGDHRPGLIAAKEHSVVHPLVLAGMTKADVRGAALGLGMNNWSKPAFACLSSRFPYGTQITGERLLMVSVVETLLKELAFRQYRVRYHGEMCRIEVRPEDLPRLVTEPIRQKVLSCCQDAGFKYVTLDLQGYRTGSLNEVLDS